jgi:hypothetical protein
VPRRFQVSLCILQTIAILVHQAKHILSEPFS